MYREQEIDYMINMLGAKDHDHMKQMTSDMVKAIFNKTLNTLEKQMKEFTLEEQFQVLALQSSLVNHDSTMSMLLKCKVMFKVRAQVVEILRLIQQREETLDKMKEIVLSIGSEEELQESGKGEVLVE